MRLIDGDKFRLALLILRDAAYTMSGNTDAVDKVLDMLDKQETVDTVKHGHWKRYDRWCNGYAYICSECGKRSSSNKDEHLEYCCHCGAKMDGESNGV